MLIRTWKSDGIMSVLAFQYTCVLRELWVKRRYHFAQLIVFCVIGFFPFLDETLSAS